MPTTSTLATGRAALVEAIDAGQLSGKVFPTRPRSDDATRAELAWIHSVKDWTISPVTMKVGRKQRDERYTLELVIWVARPEEDSDGYTATEARALELLGIVDDALADDPRLGSTDLLTVTLGGLDPLLIPWERGWACEIRALVHFHARLT